MMCLYIVYIDCRNVNVYIMYVYYNAYTFHLRYVIYVRETAWKMLTIDNLNYIDIPAKCSSDFNLNN